MSDNIDNYAEEIAPLLKLLRTSAFRFIIVGYNHGSLLRRLEDDLRQYFPERPFLILDTQKVDYRQISDAYASLGSGFLWLENFHDALREERNSLGKETPEMATGNERRRHITAGLNLRRDRLALSPIALFVCIPTGGGLLYGRYIMEKMPDLWSFRSLILDLDYQPDLPYTPPQRQTGGQIFSTLGGADQQEKSEELARLLSQLQETPVEETTYRLTLYPQIVALLTELGHYDQALGHLDDWEKMAPPDGLAALWVEKAELFDTSGHLTESLDFFKKALGAYSQVADKSQMATCHRRIGDVYRQLGELGKASEHFHSLRQLATQLNAESPADLRYKNDIGLAHERLGNVYSDMGRLKEALSEFEAYHRIEMELFTAAPEETTYKNGLAISYSNLGDTHSALGNLQKALTFYEEDIRLSKELHEAFPSNVAFKNGLAVSYSKLGDTHSALGNLQKALTFYEELNRLGRELHEAFPSNVAFKNGLSVSYYKLGETQSSLGNLQQALAFYKEDNRLSIGLFKTFPSNVDFKKGLAVSYSQLGRFYRDKKGDMETAQVYFQQSLQLWKELSEAYPAYVKFKENFT